MQMIPICKTPAFRHRGLPDGRILHFRVVALPNHDMQKARFITRCLLSKYSVMKPVWPIQRSITFPSSQYIRRDFSNRPEGRKSLEPANSNLDDNHHLKLKIARSVIKWTFLVFIFLTCQYFFEERLLRFLLGDFLSPTRLDQRLRFIRQIFDGSRFTVFEIVGKEHVSPTSVILTLERPRLQTKSKQTRKEYDELWRNGSWSVELKQPELQISRSYTPLPPHDNQKTGQIRLLIRKEYKGEVSNYVFNLPTGSLIELRGPHPEANLSAQTQDIVFLAGGTGIAPALQIAHTLFEVRKQSFGKPRMHIIWANRTRRDCEGGAEGSELTATNGVVRELQKLQKKHVDHIFVDYLVDNEDPPLNEKQISEATDGGHEGNDSKTIFVSGPKGFVEYFAGPKKWEGGKEAQGDLGGVIGRMGLTDWKVCKL
ncbi:hypothetical protein B7494_g969 [Chlorociboria aeruginascens]|nr:hypothetical protein B7494_g969 [Chlorociboria aeruginascens]